MDDIWFEGKWIELENIILSEVRQGQKARGCVFSLICGIQTQYKYKQYHGKQVTLREVTDRRGRIKKEAKKVNMVDILSIQE
jgi:hypothetical protein